MPVGVNSAHSGTPSICSPFRVPLHVPPSPMASNLFSSGVNVSGCAQTACTGTFVHEPLNVFVLAADAVAASAQQAVAASVQATSARIDPSPLNIFPPAVWRSGMVRVRLGSGRSSPLKCGRETTDTPDGVVGPLD